MRTQDHTKCCSYMYLEHVLAIGSKDRVKDEVVEVSMLRRMVVVEIDEVLYAVVRLDVANFLGTQWQPIQVMPMSNVLKHTVT